MIDTITILTGFGRSGELEAVPRIDLKMGDVVSIVGPTGSGKTTFINDIELFADANTPTGRRILINSERPPAEYRELLSSYLADLQPDPSLRNRPRVLIVTSEPLSHTHLHTALEGAGAVVVAEDDWWGSRAPGADIPLAGWRNSSAFCKLMKSFIWWMCALCHARGTIPNSRKRRSDHSFETGVSDTAT